MNLDSILHMGLAKEGKVSLSHAFQISSFLCFLDLGMQWTSFKPISALELSAGAALPLALTLAFLLVLYGFLDRVAVPVAVWGLYSLKTLFWPKVADTPSWGNESVPDYQYERFAQETNNGAAVEFVNREKSERHRFIRNGGLFLQWAWLAWGELTFCLSTPGTMGHLVFPMHDSRGIIGIGFLVCLGVTLLWIFILERVNASLRIVVSPKIYREIQDREKEVDPVGRVSDQNRGRGESGLAHFPKQPIIGSRTTI